MAKRNSITLEIVGPVSAQHLILNAGQYQIGKNPDCDIYLLDQAIAAWHAQLFCENNNWFITDLNNKIGTYVNGDKIEADTAVHIEVGDIIEIGLYQLMPIQFTAERDPFPGLAPDHSHYLRLLPEIYHTKFMTKFLAMFESILLPMEANINHFDLYLDPDSAPTMFLPWLVFWYQFKFDQSWEESKQREFLQDAHWIFARQGTKPALVRALRIYTDQTPEIIDNDPSLPPSLFIVKFHNDQIDPLKQNGLKKLINTLKPAQTQYEIHYK